MLVSMTSFWSIIETLLDIVEPKSIVEIGAQKGEMTSRLCKWGNDQNVKSLQVIETNPQSSLNEIVNQYDFVELLVGKSLDKLSDVSNVDCFFIDGDHNYYTVYHELSSIIDNNYPQIIFFHDVGWPWARRDLYYDPTGIPELYRHDYINDPNIGIIPSEKGFFKNRGFSSQGNFAFAKFEGGPKNGVLTAIEDFLNDNLNYTFHKIDCVFGLGILIRNDIGKFNEIKEVLSSYENNPLISLLEKDRIETFAKSFDIKRKITLLEEKVSQQQETLSNIHDHKILNNSATLYINLMKKSLLDLIYTNPEEMVKTPSGKDISLTKAREAGRDWPKRAMTMIGLKRLNNIQFCVENVLREDIPGDFIETGVWRGGACIFMRSLLKAYNVLDRVVWVADSFRGLPPPSPEKYPLDKNLDLSEIKELSISRKNVENNFERFDLLDSQVKFLEGWFKDTLLQAQIDKIAILRLDGDLYESTIDGLEALYHKVSSGGYIIIDDYGVIKACKQAVHDFREKNNITESIHMIDHAGAYWKKNSK